MTWFINIKPRNMQKLCTNRCSYHPSIRHYRCSTSYHWWKPGRTRTHMGCLMQHKGLSLKQKLERGWKPYIKEHVKDLYCLLLPLLLKLQYYIIANPSIWIFYWLYTETRIGLKDIRSALLFSAFFLST